MVRRNARELEPHLQRREGIDHLYRNMGPVRFINDSACKRVFVEMRSHQALLTRSRPTGPCSRPNTPLYRSSSLASLAAIRLNIGEITGNRIHLTGVIVDNHTAIGWIDRLPAKFRRYQGGIAASWASLMNDTARDFGREHGPVGSRPWSALVATHFNEHAFTRWNRFMKRTGAMFRYR